MTQSLFSSFCIALAALIIGCTCSEKQSDDEARLKKRIDATSVHLYAATKAALASKEGDAALTEITRQIAAAAKNGQPGALQPNLSAGEMLKLGKAVLSLKETGAQIVRGEKDEGDPLLRKVLMLSEAPAPLYNLFDRNMDHASLFLVEGILKINEKSPVPIPDEIVLYEAYRTNPAALTIPGIAPVVSATRAFFYGKNDFCDLSEKDALDAIRTTQNVEIFIKGITQICEGAPPPVADELKQAASAVRVIANSGPAFCHYQRGHDKKARPWLKAILDDVNNLGIVPPEETKLLDIFLRCGGDDAEVKTGIAALAALPPAKDDLEVNDRQILGAYCAASAETKGDLARKVSLTAKLVKIGLQVSKDTQIIRELESSSAYRATFGLASMLEQAAAAGGGVSDAVNTLKGIFKKD